MARPRLKINNFHRRRGLMPGGATTQWLRPEGLPLPNGKPVLSARLQERPRPIPPAEFCQPANFRSTWVWGRRRPEFHECKYVSSEAERMIEFSRLPLNVSNHMFICSAGFALSSDFLFFFFKTGSDRSSSPSQRKRSRSRGEEPRADGIKLGLKIQARCLTRRGFIRYNKASG